MSAKTVTIVVRKSWLIAAATLLLVALLAVATLAYVHSRPEYALKQAYAAVQERDADEFLLHVDVGSIADGIVVEAFEKMEKEQPKKTKSKNPFDTFADGMAQMFMGIMKPALKAEIEKAVRGYVSGDTTELSKKDSSKFDLGKMLGDGNQIRYKSLETVKSSKDTALLLLTLSKGKSDSTLPIRIQLAKRKRGWVVIRLPEILKTYESLNGKPLKL